MAGRVRSVYSHRYLAALCATAMLALGFTYGPSALAQTVLPPPEQPFPGHVGRTFRDSDPPVYREQPRAPRGAPNIVLVMLDDVGFGQFNVFGGQVPSPNLDALAAEGLRFNRFHTAGICSPTRAALLTGRNPHRAGFGIVGELATGYDGYIGYLPRSTASVAEILRQNGYATAMFGKNHNTPNWEGGPAGPFDHWPTGFGFEYFYGFNGWGTSNWHPVLFENTRPVVLERRPDYHLNRDLTDRAIAWARTIKATDPARPFLLYFATGATHSPHHAPADWVAKFRGQFDDGWDRYREQVFKRQQTMGIVPADAALTSRPPNIPAWDSLSPADRAAAARQMEVFAAFGAYTDHEVGRMLDAIRALPGAGNTLVVYVVGDNGASAEGGVQGSLNEIAPLHGIEKALRFSPQVLSELGGPRWDNNFSMGWAWAMNTPFQYYKQLVSHLGATRNPLVVSWPGHIEDEGAIRSQFLDVTDIAPTLLAVAGIATPHRVNGVTQKSMDGISFLPAVIEGRSEETRRTQYFEVFGNRAIYDRGWMASAPLAINPSQPDRASLDPDRVAWELYDLEHDFSQAHDLAAREPGKLRELQDLWWAEAARNDVLPLDWRAGERALAAERPNPSAGRTHFSYPPGLMAVPGAIAPRTHNRSWRVTAHGAFAAADSGTLATQGGLTGGWALYLQGGQLVFDYNYGLAARYRVSAPIPPQAASLSAHFTFDGENGRPPGAGGTLALFVDGVQVAAGRLEHTLPVVYSMTDGLDVGVDSGSPVSDAYEPPFVFSGRLEHVAIDLE